METAPVKNNHRQALAGKDVVIFGTGDLAQVASAYLTQDSPYKVSAFAVHEKFIRENSLWGKPVVSFEQIQQTHPPDRFAFFVAVGYKKINKARADIYLQCKEKGYELIRYVNSKAACWDNVEVGENSFIFENNVLQPFVKIGSNTILWSGNHIGHHTTIGSHCFIASHAVISGGATIGDYCFIGVNATIGDGVSVARECVIGAGALVLRDTRPGEVYRVKQTQPARALSGQVTRFK